MQRPIRTYSRISTKFAEPTRLSSFGKHLGIDYAASKGTSVYAPVSGKVTQSYHSASVGNTIEIAGDDGRIHRLLHLNTRGVGVGSRVSEGQAIATSGNTGSNSTGYHLHWDVRKGGTTYNASFNNYMDPESLLTAQSAPAQASGMPRVGQKVKVHKGQVRTTFKGGTDTSTGKAIRATDETFIYEVRGIRGYRIVINSASAGGNGVELALFYKDGKRIEGWSIV